MTENEVKRSWICTWMAAPLNSEPDILPKKLSLSGNTCRQQLKVSAGGTKLRLTFSNEYSATLDAPSGELVIKSASVAKLALPGKPDILPATEAKVTFLGSGGVAIPAGGTVTSDEIDFETESLDYIAVTICFGSTPDFPSCHREADCSTWLMSGEHLLEDFSAEEYMWSYFSLCRVDTFAPDNTQTLVCFGDSITDGSVSTFNGFDAWPNLLSDSLQSDPKYAGVSVVNSAIAGNAVYGGWGVAGKDRFERDVLEVPGVKHVVILIGTNDIPGAQTDTSEELIFAYKDMISACHCRGIRIYGGTITPFGSNDWWASSLHEQIRSKVNEWIMSGESGFDGFIDFAAAVCDPTDPQRLRADCDSGDGLHPSVCGHYEMGTAAIKAMKKYLC